MRYDVKRWLSIMELKYGEQIGFLYLMNFIKAFRNLFYNRIGLLQHFISFLCLPRNTLFIRTDDIGEGLFIQHGFSTIIYAKSIGKDCWINQQVTIGDSLRNGGRGLFPTIGDNVAIYAGAKVLGNITIGNNVKIGANAVVIKNVPDNCTAIGVPAHIIKRNGIKVQERL
jgi:serine O-acetyltransferase